MFDLISRLIDTNVYNKKYVLQQFSIIAETLTQEYVDVSLSQIKATGVNLSLTELMDNVSRLHNELKRKAIWCKDAYKHDKGRRSMYLGRDCNKIIKNSVTMYIRRIKTIESMHRVMERPLSY